MTKAQKTGVPTDALLERLSGIQSQIGYFKWIAGVCLPLVAVAIGTLWIQVSGLRTDVAVSDQRLKTIDAGIVDIRTDVREMRKELNTIATIATRIEQRLSATTPMATPTSYKTYLIDNGPAFGNFLMNEKFDKLRVIPADRETENVLTKYRGAN